MGNVLGNTHYYPSKTSDIETFVKSARNQKWLLKKMSSDEKSEAKAQVKKCYCESCLFYGLPLAGILYIVNLRILLFPVEKARINYGQEFWQFVKKISTRHKIACGGMIFSQFGILSAYFSSGCYAPALSKYYEKYRELAKTIEPIEPQN